MHAGIWRPTGALFGQGGSYPYIALGAYSGPVAGPARALFTA